MQPNLQPPRLMLHSSMSAGKKGEAVGEGQRLSWTPPDSDTELLHHLRAVIPDR